LRIKEQETHLTLQEHDDDDDDKTEDTAYDAVQRHSQSLSTQIRGIKNHITVFLTMVDANRKNSICEIISKYLKILAKIT